MSFFAVVGAPRECCFYLGAGLAGGGFAKVTVEGAKVKTGKQRGPGHEGEFGGPVYVEWFIEYTPPGPGTFFRRKNYPGMGWTMEWGLTAGLDACPGM